MFLLRRLPACLALLMLGALSLRLGLPFPLALPLTLAALVLLFIAKAAIQTALSAGLWLGAVAWLGTAWMRVDERLAHGVPWLRLALILGAVALITAWAAWLLRGRKN
ncbi:hypothetical protein GETHOR_04820 [Geothrix oryzae]|uniref:Uncharacterized protein n=1 Tax=Geothrix oryzae TaxID=2927975 RepID=A0ABM8DN59_9BACT|nr:hypothetical protein [Geothrix oryzae]BDU68381.1 hypothetical protein GETHOR_04820 [Geothrix oryzae]